MDFVEIVFVFNEIGFIVRYVLVDFIGVIEVDYVVFEKVMEGLSGLVFGYCCIGKCVGMFW